jgi:lysophospholipase
MKFGPLPALVLGFGILSGVLTSTPAHAISEKDYAAVFLNTVIPFLHTGDAYLFSTRDGLNLSGVRFIHPNAKGTIVIVPGRSEPWVKYAEVFYDLYQDGYSIYCYDHRGQGMSPHLSSVSPQIEYVADFNDYTRDLEDFMREIVLPAGDANLFLLAHSMGGGIASQYLTRGENPFKAAVLSAPMLTINTKPYSIPVAEAITAAAIDIGLGEHYALGQKDYDPKSNDVTSSPERFWMEGAIFKMYPQTIIGGASSGWVHRALVGTAKIRRKMKNVTTPVLMFQAGKDQLVMPSGENQGCAAAKSCKLMVFPESQHEILMEKDAIRGPALQAIESFFQAR